MTTQEQIRKVTDIAQEKGWSINVEDENKTSIQFEFQRYTKYGQDFNFNADMQDEDINTLIAGMKRYYEDFDPDYEAYLWIGDDGHGRNGSPYHIKDIVSDMEEAEEQIYELLQALSSSESIFTESTVNLHIIRQFSIYENPFFITQTNVGYS